VNLRPWREGGTGGDSATPTQPPEYPCVLEAGTPNTVGLAGLNVALDLVQPSETLGHERRLLKDLTDCLADQDSIRIVGDPDVSRRVGTISINIPAMRPDDVGAILDQRFNIAVRSGLHCAPLMHRAMGTFPDGTVRISPGPYSTRDDIVQLTEAIQRIQDT
jgi:cysteine desulfurase/selenocysteine lyase